MRKSAAILFCVFACSVMLGADGLTDDRRERLATAHDGSDFREEAFFALVEHFREWDGALPTDPMRFYFQPDAMTADPDSFRGELCLVLGRLEQRTALPAPYDVGEEWFIRDRSGQPVIVYVVGVDGARFTEGQKLRIVSRFYKRVDAQARDGAIRQYAAFVGARPQRIHYEDSRAPVELVVFPVGVLFGGFVLLWLYVRRQRRGVSARRRVAGIGYDSSSMTDSGGPLPENPAEALAELKRRADAERH
ncbi:MAG TPA: hypothetical protein PK400_01295 [Phycisphaerales bacterium]|nr:hypothetical protein [Phycisphaerales bacterium]HRQ74878.1 hypothetical protein [Phycisphaerales bacterium]